MDAPPKIAGSPRQEASLAVQSLRDRLTLRAVTEKDWAIHAADADRVGEFCTVYQTANLDADEKFALMALIVASLDDCLNMTPPKECDPSLGLIVEHLLRQDFALHRDTVALWCRWDADAPAPARPADEWDAVPDTWNPEWGPEPPAETGGWVFHVTPIMRRVWQECVPPPAKPL